jgi:hypothetical protein
MAAKKRENTWGEALADGRLRKSLQESSAARRKEPPYTGRDKKLLKEFGLTPMSPAVLPCPGNTFVVQLRDLTEEQARAILKAAREVGVDLEKGCA